MMVNDPNHQQIVSELQTQLATILSLPADCLPLDPKHHLVAYGLDSLGALELRNNLVLAFGEQLPVMVVLQHPTLDQLASYLLKQAKSNQGLHNKPLHPSSLGQAQPLSLAQYESWMQQQNKPDSCMAHLSLERRLLGSLNLEALQASFAEIIQRHAVLRTTYSIEENHVSQHQVETTDLCLQSLDWSEHSPQQQDQMLQDLMRPVLQEQAFDLTKLPLWHGYIVRINPKEHYLLLVFHHIQIDTLSFQLLFKEWWQLYVAYQKNTIPALPLIKRQYADYAVWQRQSLTPEWLVEKHAYWQKLLAKLPASLQLSTRKKNTLTSTSKVISHSLGQEQTQTLLSFSQKHRITLFSTLMTAFSIWLLPYSDKSGVLIGVPMSNKRVHKDLEYLIGHFAGKACLRVNFTNEPTVNQLLQRVQSQLIDALEQQSLTYQQLQLIDPSESLVNLGPFQVMMNFVTAALPTAQQHPELDLQIKPLNKFNYGVAIPELSLIVVYTPTENKQSLTFNWRYREDLFDATEVQQFANRFEIVLQTMIKDVEAALLLTALKSIKTL